MSLTNSVVKNVAITKDLIGRYRDANGDLINQFYVQYNGVTYYIRVSEPGEGRLHWAEHVDEKLRDLTGQGFGYSIDDAIKNLFQ